MDSIIKQPTGIRAVLHRKNLIYVALAFVIIVVLYLIFSDKQSKLRINSDLITVSTVTYGTFNDYTRISSVAQPINSVQLSPLESGVIETIIVEEGSSLSKGDLIATLSNNNLSLAILDSEAQLAEKQNFLRNTQVTMEQERLSLQQERLQLELDVKRKLRSYQQQNNLYTEKLIAREDWLIAKEDYELAVSNYRLILDRQKQDSIYRSIQVSQMEESLHNMQRNMLLVRQRINNLNIKSHIDGNVGILDFVLGETINAGDNIGQINNISDFKLEANISETYIDRVHTGLIAELTNIGGDYSVTLFKIYPEVTNGTFRAEFRFNNSKPKNIRSGQTYYLNLQLGESSSTLMVERGTFYQGNGESYVYVINADGDKAYKRPVRIARQNPRYYEITEGLAAGERIITSSYNLYKDKDILIFNKPL